MSSVLITGANRGLGLEFARQYAADGWDVIATARDPKSSEELQQLVRNKNVSLSRLDVTSAESVKQLAETLSGEPVDLLVLNSAIYTRNGNKLGRSRNSPTILWKLRIQAVGRSSARCITL